MGWRTYGEPKPKESPVGEFLVGLYLGTFGIYGGGGWALISLGWVSPGAMLVICTGIGLLLGGKLAYHSVCPEKDNNRKGAPKWTGAAALTRFF